MTIERKDPHGNYEPSNCRWATDREQRVNKRNTRWIEFSGEKKPLAEVCRQRQMRYSLSRGA
jgi:hypothetical protein